MSTNSIIALVVVVLLLVGGGYYYMQLGGVEGESDRVTAGDVTGDGTADVMDDESGNMFSGSWNDLATRGGNYTCDISTAGAGDTTSGTVYVSGTSVRGDFSVSSGGSTVVSHMLKSGDTVYVWGGGMEQGIMMKATAMGPAASGQAPDSGVTADQPYNWNCSPGSSDSSKFVKPSGVEFMDLNTMMQGSGGAGMMPSN